MSRPKCFGCVFNNRYTVFLADWHDRLVVSTLAVHIHDHSRFRKSIELRSAAKFIFEQLWIEVPGLAIAVNENGDAF